MADIHIEQVVEKMRQQCLAKGIAGIKGLGVLFRGFDRDYSKRLSAREFTDGIKRYGIELSAEETTALFAHFDKDKSGEIDFAEFLVVLRPPLSASRLLIINKVFDKLDTVKDGVLRAEDIRDEYREHAEKHPKVISGEWNVNQALQAFLATFDDPVLPDGVVTREEFTAYYTGVSATVDDDIYFDNAMRKAWGLPDKDEVSDEDEYESDETS